MEKKKSLLITGCGGMLGEGVYALTKDRYDVHATDIDLNEPWLNLLDVSNDDAVRAYGEKVEPDIIFHLAAMTDMEYCQNHPDESFKTNGQGTENMVALAKSMDIPLVYICTAGIFDGNKDAYDENDVPSPLSVYGKSKYAGEVVVRVYPKSIVVRAGWMMGGGPKKDKKFINKIIKQLQGGVRELSVVDDKLGTPTYTYDLAKILVYLSEHSLYGLYHGVCDGGASRYDVALEMIDILGLKGSVAVKVVGSDYFQSDYFAPRPTSERLINAKLKAINGALTRDWRVCLRDYLTKFDWNVPGARIS